MTSSDDVAKRTNLGEQSDQGEVAVGGGDAEARVAVVVAAVEVDGRSLAGSQQSSDELVLSVRDGGEQSLRHVVLFRRQHRPRLVHVRHPRLKIYVEILNNMGG